MPVFPFEDTWPDVAEDCFIAPTASVVGDVVIGPGSSVWFGAVIRGDVFHIRIGARTNIQDNSVIHVTTGQNPAILGSDVTVGHRAIVHGCEIEDGCLVGMGSIVMDRVVVGRGSIVGAGALVLEGTQVPPGSVIVGAPAKVVRMVTPEERQFLAWSTEHYAALAATHAARLGWGQGHR